MRDLDREFRPSQNEKGTARRSLFAVHPPLVGGPRHRSKPAVGLDTFIAPPRPRRCSGVGADTPTLPRVPGCQFNDMVGRASCQTNDLKPTTLLHCLSNQRSSGIPLCRPRLGASDLHCLSNERFSGILLCRPRLGASDLHMPLQRTALGFLLCRPRLGASDLHCLSNERL